MDSTETLAQLKQKIEIFKQRFESLRAEVARVIVGQGEVVQATLLALMADGHVLLEGLPGLGKTLLMRTLGEAMGLRFARVQFTPDLMPADIVGTNLIVEDQAGNKRFRFQPGPVFTNLLLADEINRATPKTQSALLEAMQERQVTIGGTTYPLEGVFFVLATQNPLEMEGTYPLPEAQLDRFLFKVLIEFPDRDDLIEVMNRTTALSAPHAGQVLAPEDLIEMRRLVREVITAPHVEELVADIVLSTHPSNKTATKLVHKYIRFGASPRGAQAIILTAKARALLSGRYNVSRSDVIAVAKPALRHRLIVNYEGEADGIDTDAIIEQVITEVSGKQEPNERRIRPTGA